MPVSWNILHAHRYSFWKVNSDSNQSVKFFVFPSPVNKGVGGKYVLLPFCNFACYIITLAFHNLFFHKAMQVSQQYLTFLFYFTQSRITDSNDYHHLTKLLLQEFAFFCTYAIRCTNVCTSGNWDVNKCILVNSNTNKYGYKTVITSRFSCSQTLVTFGIFSLLPLPLCYVENDRLYYSLSHCISTTITSSLVYCNNSCLSSLAFRF